MSTLKLRPVWPSLWRQARALSCGLLAAGVLLIAGPAQAVPPPAPSHPVTDTLHGVAVPDPYRNLEDVSSAETKAWLQAEGDEASAQLARLGGRAELAQRIEALAGAAGDAVYGVTRMPGERIYYLLRKKGQSQFKLMLRVGLRGADRVLVDPEQLAKATGVPHAINYFRPSWDGRTLAYGVSAGGSEDASLHLMDIASGRAIGKPIPRVHEGLLSWTPDSRALSFNQTRELAPGTPDTETFLDTTTWLLRPARPGQPAAQPVRLFGPLVNPDLGLDRMDVAGVVFTPGSRWMVARTTDTTVPEGKLFVAPLAQLGRAGGKQPIAWRHLRIMATVPGVFSAQRFTTGNPGHPPSLAMYGVASADVFKGEYYLSVRGMGVWLPLIDKQWYRRNLFDGLEVAPTVSDDQVLLVADRDRPDASLCALPFTWLKVAGIDRSTPYRGIAVVNTSVAQDLPDNIAIYTPASRRYVKGNEEIKP